MQWLAASRQQWGQPSPLQGGKCNLHWLGGRRRRPVVVPRRRRRAGVRPCSTGGAARGLRCAAVGRRRRQAVWRAQQRVAILVNRHAGVWRPRGRITCSVQTSTALRFKLHSKYASRNTVSADRRLAAGSLDHVKTTSRTGLAATCGGCRCSDWSGRWRRRSRWPCPKTPTCQHWHAHLEHCTGQC